MYSKLKMLTFLGMGREEMCFLIFGMYVFILIFLASDIAFPLVVVVQDFFFLS